MALWVCKDCTCAYSVGAPGCPQCGSKKHAEQGSKGDPATKVIAPSGLADVVDVKVGAGQGAETDA